MCRHAAYVGPGITLDDLVLVGEHSLLNQSYAARELMTGVVCADGFGVAWYDPDTRPEPARYISIMPVWADTNLPSFGPVVRTPVALALVRNATEAGSTSEANSHPFVDGRHAFSHNGYLENFADVWRDHMLRQWIAPDRRGRIRGTTDSEYLFQALMTLLDAAEREPAALATATQTLIRNVVDHARANGVEAQLNFIVTGGHEVVATRAGSRERQNSLYLLVDGDAHPDGCLVASEPLDDDPRWEPVPENALLVLGNGAPAIRLQA